MIKSGGQIAVTFYLSHQTSRLSGDRQRITGYSTQNLTVVHLLVFDHMGGGTLRTRLNVEADIACFCLAQIASPSAHPELLTTWFSHADIQELKLNNFPVIGELYI